jgi:hypothetical protein
MRTYLRLADLPLSVESYSLKGLAREVSSAFTRHTTQVRLVGEGCSGVGEDVSYDAADQQLLQAEGRSLKLDGVFTLDGFSTRLAETDLFPKLPSQSVYRNYRRWAFESAALDLALRQAGQSLASRLERKPAPVRFVVSMGLGHPASAARLLDWLELYPDLGFKLDASSAWDDALTERLKATDAVEIIDLKGAYHGTPVDQAPDPDLYRRVAQAFPGAWLEDPALTAETRAALDGHLDRVTWDAPIHSVEDILGLDRAPKVINVKPSRFGSVSGLMDVYDYCNSKGIGMYGGGQFELGVGRGQIQYLASLFHPQAPNDTAPVGFNEPTPTCGLESSPLEPSLSLTGYRRDTP